MSLYICDTVYVYVHLEDKTWGIQFEVLGY